MDVDRKVVEQGFSFLSVEQNALQVQVFESFWFYVLHLEHWTGAEGINLYRITISISKLSKYAHLPFREQTVAWDAQLSKYNFAATNCVDPLTTCTRRQWCGKSVSLRCTALTFCNKTPNFRLFNHAENWDKSMFCLWLVLHCLRHASCSQKSWEEKEWLYMCR